MANNKHLTLDEHSTIESMLKYKTYLTKIGIDLPRKIRFSARKHTVHIKVNRTFRIGRDYD